MKDYNQLSSADGQILVKATRQIIKEYLTNHHKIKLGNEIESNYSFKAGVFVTLNKGGQLRGCIGFVLPEKKLFDALTDASVAAATEDPRFPVVNAQELDKITIEVTVLQPPTEIQVSHPSEYPSKIKVGRDGLIVKHSFNSGLLLPQVPVEYRWSKEEFLGHTCEKAGLPSDFWKNPDVKIQKFEAVVFKEERPSGKVTIENLLDNNQN